MGTARTPCTLSVCYPRSPCDRCNLWSTADADKEREVHGSGQTAEPTQRSPIRNRLVRTSDFGRGGRPFHLELFLLTWDFIHNTDSENGIHVNGVLGLTGSHALRAGAGRQTVFRAAARKGDGDWDISARTGDGPGPMWIIHQRNASSMRFLSFWNVKFTLRL